MVGKVYLTDLNLSFDETRDIIEFLARKRNIKNYKRKSSNGLFLAIKEINQQEQERNRFCKKRPERIRPYIFKK